MSRAGTYLFFIVRDRTLAVPLASVRRVHQAVTSTPLPDQPESVVGVVNVHGRMVVLIDPAIRLGFPPTPVRASQAFIEIHTTQRDILVVADAILDVASLCSQDIVTAEELFPGYHGIVSIASFHSNPVFLSDPETLLSGAEHTAVDDAFAEISEEKESNPNNVSENAEECTPLEGDDVSSDHVQDIVERDES